MSDLLITDQAVEAAIDLTYRGKQLTPSHARAVLEAALPLLQRQHLELAGTLAYELGRRDAAEDITQAIEANRPGAERAEEPGDWKRGDRHGRLRAAAIAREFATRPCEPSGGLTHPTGPTTPESAQEAPQ